MKCFRLSRKTVIVLACLSIVLIVVVALFVGSWFEFRAYYLSVMKNLNSPETKVYMHNRINGTYDFLELLNWTNQNLNWTTGIFLRYSEPQQILTQGKGRCGEFSIVYVAACIAMGYEAKLVSSRQFYLFFSHGFHVWAEVKRNGVWTHVDPSPTAFWNDTSRYQSWNWGPRSTLSVLAFEDVRIEDVTSRYR